MREISGRRRSQRALTALLALATLLGLLALPAPPRAHAAGGGLAGTPFGLGPVWAPGTEYDKAFDGSTGTFFDYLYPDGGYTGIDLGAGNARTIVKVRFHPRNGFEGRMVGGRFQGSNAGPDSGYTDLAVIEAQPDGGWSTLPVSDPTPYRYLRYLAPAEGYGNIAELEFYDALTPAPPPDAWSNQDVGNTGVAGGATFADGVFSVAGGGDNIGGGYDQFHFVYQPMAGDGQIVARVLEITGGAANTKAALMVRETLDGWPPAREAFVGVTSANGAFFEARLAPEASTVFTPGPAVAAPAWLKLVRRGDTFTGSISSDGLSWQTIGSATVPMGGDVYVGLAAGGRTYGQLATSRFDGVDFRLLAPGPISASVGWDDVRSRTSAASFGLNLFSGFNPAEAAAGPYNTNLAYMAPGVVRYHSIELMGDSQTTRNGWVDYANRRWDAAKIDAALDGLTAIDPTVLITIPLWPSWMDQDGDGFLDAGQLDAFAAFCAELVRIVNLEHGHGVRYWEPTNELDDLYYVRFANGGQPDRLDELIEIYNRAARAMKAVDPGIAVGGLAFARPDLYPQVERFLAGALGQSNPATLDFLSIHGYASGSLSDPDRYIYNRAVNPAEPELNTLTSHAADIRAMLDAASPGRHIPLWFDEYNISWDWRNNDPRMKSNKGAVFDALMMTALHDAGIEATLAWNEKDGVYGKSDGADRLRPAAHLFALMNRYAVGERVATSSTSPAEVATFAVKSESRGLRSYLLINRSPVEQEVFTSFGGWRPRYERLTRFTIAASGYSEDSVPWAAMTAAGLRIPPHSVTMLVAAERPVRPVLECVAPNSDGSYTAYFGYKNDNGVAVAIPVGGQNRFSPAPDGRGQPASFAAGRQARVFSVAFSGGPLVWTLAGRTATASSDPRQRCR